MNSTDSRCVINNQGDENVLEKNLGDLAQLYQGIPLTTLLGFASSLVIIGSFLIYKFVTFTSNSKRASITKKSEKIKSFCSWIKSIFSATLDEVETSVGRDASLYLQLQKNCIWLMVVIFVVSIGIILPLNLVGEHLGSKVIMKNV